ncbi:MAG: acyl-phosphate glycerol 3-phosphate acyltransferase [Dactylosporangium sp.]|nr:1-acyl-sn-glycerol-3-phosphate acyltransferase [Dactylosporangium sp.]NNJ62322.1 acyl-phosphate glycerol 3-phosphate acyltransferase [Dactylosporangium sp.]
MIRKKLFPLILRAAGWRLVGEVPKAGVLIGAPHTSNVDFALMLLVTGAGGISPKVLIKEGWFWGPVGWFLRKVGGVPVDRRNAAGMVRELVGGLRGDEVFPLVIAPEGMRRKSNYWKSGFYRIAVQSGLPIAMGFIDGPTKTVGFGPTLAVTGNVVEDMNQIRAFYADKHGLRPAWRTEPRLREERRAGGS